MCIIMLQVKLKPFQCSNLGGHWLEEHIYMRLWKQAATCDNCWLEPVDVLSHASDRQFYCNTYAWNISMKSPPRESSVIGCFFSNLQKPLPVSSSQTNKDPIRRYGCTFHLQSQITSSNAPDYRLLPTYWSINPEEVCLFACLIQKPTTKPHPGDLMVSPIPQNSIENIVMVKCEVNSNWLLTDEEMKTWMHWWHLAEQPCPDCHSFAFCAQ